MQTRVDTSACAYTCICARVRTLYRILYTRTQFVQTNGLTTRNSLIWREDSRSGGRADLDRWDGARLARSRAGAGAEPAVRQWVRERKMRLCWNRPAAVVPLDPEQALDTWQRLGITFDLFTTMHGESRRLLGWLVAGALAGVGAVLVGVYKINASNAMPKPYLTVYIYIYVRTRVRTHVHARGQSQTVLANECKRTRKQINARKRVVAFDAWAISACKHDCVLRVRSKTFRMYCN